MRFGKPSLEVMTTVLHNTGSKSSRLILGPRPGVDVSILRISNRKVLIGSMDPITLIPRLGPERSGFLTVHAIASDVATSGRTAEFAFFNLNLPPSIADRTLRQYWKAISRYCAELDIAIVGGHTGRFQGIDYTVVGSCTMLALAPDNSYVNSSMAKKGDDLIATKSVALEASTVMSLIFPNAVRKQLGSATAASLKRLFGLVTTVKDGIVASSVGLRKNVTAMHDVTEGGIFSAVCDLANASKLKASVELDSVPIYDEVQALCKVFRIDPYTSLGQGCLLIASRPAASDNVLRTLRRNGIDAGIIGHLSSRGRNQIVTKSGKARLLKPPIRDPYWKAYWNGIKRGLK